MSEFAIARLMANLRTQLPGALDSTLKLEIFNAVHDFCVATNVWENTQEFTTKINKQFYEITAPSPDQYYTQLLSLVLAETTDPADQRVTPTPVSAVLSEPTQLKLLTVPTIVQRMSATFAMAPRPTDNMEEFPSIPESFWDKYHNALFEGALSKMMAQVAKPYSNERMGIYHGRRFMAFQSTHKVEKYNGMVRGGQNWSFPRFA